MEVISDFIDKVSHEGAQHTGDVSNVIQAKLKMILSDMIDGCDEIIGAMISSVDGLAWAELLPEGLDPNRFAAMSSAMLALGDTMMKETPSRQLSAAEIIPRLQADGEIILVKGAPIHLIRRERYRIRRPA